MKVFFATDIHGSEICFKKFINAGKHYGADIIMLGGDITGKGLVPIQEKPDGSYHTSYIGDKHILNSNELESLFTEIRNSGYYPYVCDSSKLETLNDDDAAQRIFMDTMVKELHRWFLLADQRLEGTGIQCYICLGNDDHPELLEAFKGIKHVVNPEEEIIELPGGLTLLSEGHSNPTPFHSPRELDEDVLLERIMVKSELVKDNSRCVFNIHCPPSDTHLDLAPKLTSDLRPVTAGGNIVMEHVGSSAVRKAIEIFQPMLGLHGHIHESKGMCRIGKTVCLNPGSEYSQGILRGVIVHLIGPNNAKYGFTSG